MATVSPWRKIVREISEIVPGKLYLSGAAAVKYQRVRALNIKWIINVTKDHFYRSLVPGVEYYRIAINDEEGVRLPLEETTNFIRERMASHAGAVLIHCHMGISRSAALVIAYIMDRDCISFADALAFVKTKRPIVYPNESFVKQLLAWDMRPRLLKDDHAERARSQ